jgi:hypothetical protein
MHFWIPFFWLALGSSFFVPSSPHLHCCSVQFALNYGIMKILKFCVFSPNDISLVLHCFGRKTLPNFQYHKIEEMFLLIGFVNKQHGRANYPLIFFLLL